MPSREFHVCWGVHKSHLEDLAGATLPFAMSTVHWLLFEDEKQILAWQTSCLHLEKVEAYRMGKVCRHTYTLTHTFSRIPKSTHTQSNHALPKQKIYIYILKRLVLCSITMWLQYLTWIHSSHTFTFFLSLLSPSWSNLSSSHITIHFFLVLPPLGAEGCLISALHLNMQYSIRDKIMTLDLTLTIL